jgi:hypothetical protein
VVGAELGQEGSLLPRQALVEPADPAQRGGADRAEWSSLGAARPLSPPGSHELASDGQLDCGGLLAVFLGPRERGCKLGSAVSRFVALDFHVTRYISDGYVPAGLLKEGLYVAYIGVVAVCGGQGEARRLTV